jgi:hypothetical protein
MTQQEEYDNLDDPMFDDIRDARRFADPGGDSALHAADKNNPRNLACPTCGRENVLTPKDRAAGYQCDRCADIAEGKIIE